MFFSDLINEPVRDVPCVLSQPFLCKPRVELASPPAPSAITACLLWQKVAGVIIRVGFVTAFEGGKVMAEKSWEIPDYTSLVTVDEHVSTWDYRWGLRPK